MWSVLFSATVLKNYTKKELEMSDVTWSKINKPSNNIQCVTADMGAPNLELRENVQKLCHNEFTTTVLTVTFVLRFGNRLMQALISH